MHPSNGLLTTSGRASGTTPVPAAGLNPEPTCALLFHCAIVLNTLVKSGSLGQGQNTVADQPHGVLLELPAGFRPMNHVQRTPRGYDERR